MSRISQYLPKSTKEIKDLLVRARFDHLLTTDILKVGDKVSIRDAEEKEVWVIHKFISHHPSEKPVAVLLLDEENDWDSGTTPASSVMAFLDQLILCE